MRSRVLVLFAVVAVAAVLLYRPHVESRRSGTERIEPQVIKATAFAVSPSVRSIAVDPVKARPKDSSNLPLKRVNEEAEEESAAAPPDEGRPHDADGSTADFSVTPMPDAELSFDGLSNYDNIDLSDALYIPPDPIGDVGPAHYVQAVNVAVRIYTKSGSPAVPAFKLSSLFSSLGTPCSTRNDGDPNVVYDPLADRWILSQFCTAFPPFRQMVAISKTGDPAGQYYVYEFVMPNVRLNDYAKLSVWTDGYYMSTDEFVGSDYAGSGAFAFDRKRLLAGDPSASYIYFNLPQTPGERYGGLLPADLDGLNPPPTNAPNIFVGYSATEYGDPFDGIRLFEFHADFSNPLNSTFRERPESPIGVASFDPTSPPGRTDILQPPPGEWVDSMSDRMMYRIAYRNSGNQESLVFNQTVRTTPQSEPYRGGVRLYELRRPSGGIYSVAEQSTIGDTTVSRWSGAAAQDHQGNLAVAYSLTSTDKKPGIAYTGRLSGEPQGMLRTETALISGTGVQKAFGFRWGDYSGMSVDPVDDCTFWLTNEYFTLESETFSDFMWLTRIGRFKYAECAPATRATITGTITDASNGRAVLNATVTASSYTRSSDAAGSYGNMMVVPGTYSLTGSARGYREAQLGVSVAAGQTVVRSFALEPVPVIESTSAEITSESCSMNHAAEPGETVTIELGLRNTGRMPANGLTAALRGASGVINTGPPQNYGSLPADGTNVSRPFTFTVAPGVACGRAVDLAFDLAVGSMPLQTLVVPLRAGEVRFAVSEHFDVTARPRLPLGWSTSATGAQRPWLASQAHSTTPPNSMFSPDPNQIGLNEVVSPPIPIISSSAKLSFRNWYELETTFLRNRLYDGSVLEISIGDGDFQDIISAGGTFESGGYDGIIDSCCQNPLAGRRGWSGRSGINQTSEFITSTVRLPASAAGHSVRFRWRVGTDIGTFREGQYIDDVTVTDGYTCSCSIAAGGPLFDFDGDGKTDLSVFQATDIPDAPDFMISNSGSGSLSSIPWGSTGDLAANADFDGDRKTDLAIFRPTSGVWYILRSTDTSVVTTAFGQAGDRPLPFDFDGDGRADVGVYRALDGVWYSLNSFNGQFSARQFGLSGDIPSPGDFDGDGKADLAVFRQSTGVWYVARSSDAGYTIAPFGQSGDKPVAGDFDGDGRADLVVFRPGSGVWYLLRSELGFAAVQFGLAGDQPLQADFDGDGQNEIAVFRPSTSTWFYVKSSNLEIVTMVFGRAGDKAVPSIFTEN